MDTHYINCDSCAHCVDFHTPKDDQPEALTKAQADVAAKVATWLDDAKKAREESQTEASKNETEFLQ